MTTSEGGAVASTNPELLQRARRFSRQGLIRNSQEFRITDQGAWHQEVNEFGLNYRLPDVLCALGISQLSRLESFKEARKKIYERYVNGLIGTPNLILPHHCKENDVMWHLFPIRVPVEQRRAIFESLRSKGIMVQVNYLPAYRHPVFSTYNLKVGSFPVSDDYYAGEISLPMYSDLEINQQDEVIQTLLEILREKCPTQL